MSKAIIQGIVLSISVWITLVKCHTADEWKSRIIYQLLTDRFGPTGDAPATDCSVLTEYCGGTFRGIQQRLDYIQGLGANAIWISPLIENTPGGFHGYWAKNIYKVNPYFGTQQDLKRLVEACHDRDIWVMADVVANHMGNPYHCRYGCDKDHQVNFTGFTPFDKASHFHSLCEITDWKNQTQVEICRLAGLPDLKQTDAFVHERLLDWISNLTKVYNFDGYRIDTVVEVSQSFWAEFQQAAGVYCVGEANNGDSTSYVAGYQGPLDAVLNFPLFWALRNVFNYGHSMRQLTDSLNEQRKYFSDITVLGLFLDNHDFERFLNLTDDTALLKNVIVYILLSEGIPIIYYGTEQGFHGGKDPSNRESLWPHYNTDGNLYQFIRNVSQFKLSHKDVDFGSRNQVELYVNESALLFTRGKNQEVLVAITKYGKHADYRLLTTRQLQGYRDGTIFEGVLHEDRVQIENCSMSVTIVHGMPSVYKVIKQGQGRSCYPFMDSGGTIADSQKMSISFLHFCCISMVLSYLQL